LIRQSFKSYGYFFTIFIIGSSIALAHYYYQSQNDRKIQERHFQYVLQQYSYAIENQLEIQTDIPGSLQALFLTRRFVSRKDFSIYSDSILKRNHHVSAVAWIPKTPIISAQRLVRNARADGLSDYQISSLGDENDTLDRDLLPVLYVEPLAPNLSLLGIDLGSNQDLFTSLQGLAVSNKALMSNPISSSADVKQNGTVTLFLPHYRKSNLENDLELSWESLEGFFMVQIQFDRLLQTIIDQAYIDSKTWLELTNQKDKSRLAGHANLDQVSSQSDISVHSAIINFAGRSMKLRAMHTQEPIQFQTIITPALVVFMSLLTAILFQVQQGKQRKFRGQIIEQTNAIEVQRSELENAYHRLDLALVSTNQGHWDWDIPSGEVFFSPTMEVMAGYQAGEWATNRSTFADFVPPKQYEQVSIRIKRHLSGETSSYQSEHEFRRKDGSYMWIRDHGKVVEWDESGKPVRMIGTHLDISREKKIHNELILSKEAAETAAIAKTRFLSTMSQEIRTPMNGVMGMAQLLEDTPLDSEQRDYVNTINRSGNNLLSIINDILDYSKLDVGKTHLESISFDLERLCQESMELFSASAADSGVDLILDYPIEQQRHFLGDPARLRQIVLNLIGNAVKFTASGYIRLGVLVDSNGTLSHIKMSIEDSGIGMPAESLDNLFDEFSQADQSTTRIYGGTGLGLAIVRKIVNLLGGKIAVESTVGKGSVFLVELTCSNSEVDELPLDRSLAGIRVLLVDDLTENIRVFGSLLKYLKVDLTTVGSAHQAIEVLEKSIDLQQPFKIAILDHNMPQMTGVELGHWIRARDQFESLKLLIFSAVGQKGDAEMFRKVGFDAYLNKLSRRQTIQRMLLILLESQSRDEIITQHNIEDRMSGGAEIKLHFDAKILMAEDIKPNQIIARKFIEQFGADLEIVDDGNEALTRWREGNFDLILMDCRMPGMDGYDATQKIRHEEKRLGLKRIPIIALTTNASTEDRTKCIESGMDDIITKPYKKQGLGNILDIWLNGSRESVEEPIVEASPEALAPENLKTISVSHPIWDQACYYRLKDYMEEDLDEIITAIFETLDTNIMNLVNADDKTPIEDLILWAHSLKSPAGNIGALKLANIAADLEGQFRKDSREGLDQSLTDMQLSFKQMKKLFEEFDHV
jgi:PAS domain S-box-containing protein